MARELPWSHELPLMLAPMQGLTNRGLRGLFARTVKPDVLFTEYIQVRPRAARRLLSETDRLEVLARTPGIPLVVQLIGPADFALVETAVELEKLGVRHININMGCPFGRQVSRMSGGKIFKDPAPVPELLRELRNAVHGSLSVKARSGFDDPRQIFALVDAFEAAELDFLVLHPRTVVQKYEGQADHAVTAELVRATRIPVIANGDIVAVADARRVLEKTGAAGLMLGRGALADPWLFERIRGRAPERATPETRREELSRYLRALVDIYRELFSGDGQALDKIKGTLAFVEDPELERWVRALRRCKRLDAFAELLREEAAASGASQPAVLPF